MLRDPQMAGGTVELMGTCLIVGDGQHGLMYPESVDDYLRPRPLLDADLVLVESSQDIEIPKLVAVSENPLETEYEEIIAYVGATEKPPLLDSNVRYFSLNRLPEIVAEVDAFLSAKVEQIPVYGLVLAGGLSTRMGRDKGALEYHGKSQIAHCHGLLSQFCERVYVSNRAGQELEEAHAGFDHIPDAFVGLGPMGGILSALRSDSSAAWLVLACDLPYVTDATLDTLLRSRNPFKLATAYISAHGGLPEPLCTIYEPKSVHRLMSFLAQGYQCPRKVLINSDTSLIQAPENGELDNVNSPKEYEAAQTALRKTTQNFADGARAPRRYSR